MSRFGKRNSSISGSVRFGGANAEATTARAVTLKWTANTRMRLLLESYDMNLVAFSPRLDVLCDLRLLPGQDVCFRIKAYNNIAKSAFSPAVCSTI